MNLRRLFQGGVRFQRKEDVKCASNVLKEWDQLPYIVLQALIFFSLVRMLYNYVVREDIGFAPNVQNGLCSLGLSKPRIRRAAKIGDWLRDFQGRKPATGLSMQ